MASSPSRSTPLPRWYMTPRVCCPAASPRFSGTAEPAGSLPLILPEATPTVLIHEAEAELTGRELTAFYAWAEQAKWYFRKPKTSRHNAEYRIPRDEVICSLVRKLVSTQDAIYKLCEAELCNDALALSRIAFENAITIGWMLRGHTKIQAAQYIATFPTPGPFSKTF